MQLEQPPGEYLVQQEVKRLTSEAMTGGRFPPVIRYPESKRGDVLLSTFLRGQLSSGFLTRSAASNALSLYTYEEVWSFEGGNEACPRGYTVSTWIVKYCGKYQATSRKAILQVALLVCRSSATQYAVKPAVLISLSPIGRAVLRETESSRSVNAIGGLVGEVTHLQRSL
ncbi:hypothetical protein GQ600_15807 [Phytophthora cactorum]|nr:hypothetical protein GQ600_15807 [Phytophthora cactorum]